ncbi:hypothetical protein B484DRAFT_43094 [Ochromonadaceae sp. CCMP2298]|nr:hypothetical protein B484DRAFT_43094 [Ochromonadaceae sp. CCMP2298]
MLRFCLRNLARPSPITSLHSLHSLSPLVSAARTGTMGSVGTVGTARTARAGIVGKGTRGRWCQPCRHSSTGQKITQSGSSGRSGSRSSGGGSGGNGGGGGRGKAERDDEGMLLASTDPIGIISSRFNPYVIRHFKEFRDAVGGPGAGIGGIGGIGGGTGVGGMGGKGGGQGQELGEGVEGVEGVEGNQGTRSKSLRIAFRKTEDTLLSLNHSIKRVPNRSVYRNHLSFKHEAKRSSLGENCSRMLRECRSDREYAALAAFMTIMVPKSEQVWLDYDRYILNMLQRGRCSGEVGLLSVNAVLTAQEEHTFQGSRFKSPKAYVEHLLAGRKALGAGEWGVGGGCVGGAGVEGGVGTGVGAGADVNIFDAESFARAWQVQAPKAGGAGAGAGAGGAGKGARNSTSTPTTPTPVTPPQAEMFASIGVKAQVRDSPDAERLGLQLRLLALVMPWRAGMASQKEHKTLLQDMTSQGIKVLSGLHNPVKLNTLRVIWEHAPHVHLPNSYFFYKLLYEQVLYSLTAEPLQLVGQERAVAKLLESMVLSKFKSSQLLACLQEVTGRQVGRG